MRHEGIHPITRLWPGRLLGRPGRSRGQSLLEMALLAPLLLLILFGIIEMGRLFFIWVTVQHVARTAVRVAVAGPDDQGRHLSRIVDEARRVAATLPGGAGSASIVVRSQNRASGGWRDGDPGGPCDLVEVEIRYTYRPVVPFIALLLPQRINLTGKERKVNEPWRPCP